MASLDVWVNDELHNILGISDKYIGQFFINLAAKSSSADELVQKIRDTGTIDVDSSIESFASQLWNKVGLFSQLVLHQHAVQLFFIILCHLTFQTPHSKPQPKAERLREQEIVKMIEKNKSYKLLSDEEDESSVVHAKV